MARGDALPWYQPVVDGRTGLTAGAEVLARLPLPDGTVAGPAAFLPLAQQAGLMRSLLAQVSPDVAVIPLPAGFRLLCQ